MSGFLEDTANVARPWCPGCEPDADPIAEMLEVRRCGWHPVTAPGPDDNRIVSEAALSGSAEAGEDGAAWCRFFHRQSRHLLPILLCWTVMAAPVRVIDGDTLVVDAKVWSGLTARETVRVLGVNAPEMHGTTKAAGEEARAYVALWVAEQQLRLVTCQRDSFGRILATITRNDGRNLTLDLIEAGHGVKR